MPIIQGGGDVKHVKLVVRVQMVFVSFFKLLIVYKCFEMSRSNVIFYFERRKMPFF